jgi:hypothetical protein
MYSWHRNGGQLRLLRRNCRTSHNTRSLEAIAAVMVSIDGVSVEHLGSVNRCRETGSQHDRRRRRGPCDVHNRRRRTCCAWWRQWLIILRDIRVRVPVIDVPRVAIHQSFPRMRQSRIRRCIPRRSSGCRCRYHPHNNTLPLCFFPVHLVQKSGREKRGKTKEEKTKSLTQHHPSPHDKSFTPRRHRDRNFFFNTQKSLLQG